MGARAQGRRGGNHGRVRVCVREIEGGGIQREEERGGKVGGGGIERGSPSGTVGGLSHARTCGGCLDWRKCFVGGVGLSRAGLPF